MSSRATLGAVCAGMLVLAATVGSAEELRPQLNPSVILNMLARPLESPESAFSAALRSDGVPSRTARADEGQVLPVLPDRSVRDGRGSASVTVTVRNPCSPGDVEYEAASLRLLPGRSRR